MTFEGPINLLRTDVAAWNAWREQHKTTELLNLVGADLSNVHLQGANLTHVYLNHANFQGADVRGADFLRASLIGADFQEANLSHADFTSTTGFSQKALEKKLVPTLQESRSVQFALKREQQEHRTILFPIFLDQDALESDVPWIINLRASGRIFDFTHWQDERSYRRAFEVLYQKLVEVEADTR